MLKMYSIIIMLVVTQVLHATIINMHYNFADNGAIETHLLLLSKQLHEHAINNVLLTSNKSHFVINTARKELLSYKTFYHDGWGPQLSDFTQHNLTNAGDIIICNGIGHLTTAFEAQKKYGSATILMHHYFFTPLLEQTIPRLNDLSAVVTVSPLVAQQLLALQKKGIITHPIIQHIAPFWHDHKFATFTATRTREDFFLQEYGLSISPNSCVITMLANLYWCKNQQLLLHALKKIIKDYPQVIVIFAGEGDDRSALESLCKDLHLQQHAFFIGRTEKTPELLHHSDIHLLASEHEGLGIAHLEAAMMYKPFVGATNTGIQEIIQPYVTGLLFKNNDVHDLADKLLWLIQNPKKRQAMGHAARIFVQEHYSTKALFNQWQSLFTTLQQLRKDVV